MKHARGKVFLIGAGPGDPGLMTVKGLGRLREADLVLYDHLVNPAILKWAKPGARALCVGKKGQKPAPKLQDRINRTLAREAAKGMRIVRLKGGDPYLFGRGAEEAGFLSAKGVAFEVVPGVTSALGCAAYAGIPLTERRLSSSVAFITGHGAGEGKVPSLRWRALAESADTLVVYMGIANIRGITRRLMENGAAPRTPAAVVEWGTWTRQKSVSGALSAIAGKVAAAKIGPPAMLIVGKVVKLKKRLGWFEKLPLYGKTVVLTRPEGQADRFRIRLEELGAQVAEVPTIEIRPPSSWEALDGALDKLRAFDWIIFTSVNAVAFFFERLLKKPGRDARALGAARVAAIGPATRAALEEKGIRADFMPSHHTTEALGGELLAKHRSFSRARVLIPRSRIAAPELAARLKAAGAAVTEVDAYDTVFPAARIRQELGRINKSPVHAIVFTSASTVTGLARAAGTERFRRMTARWPVYSIGPATTRELKAQGARIRAEAATHSETGLIEAILKANRK